VLDRALGILEFLAEQHEPLGLTELAERLALNKSTAHRLAMILERHRMIERDSQMGRYRLGMRLFELGSIAISRFDIREKARMHLEQLRYEVDESVHLCTLDNGEVLYLDRVEPTRSVRMECRVGRRNPAHCTAVGKAMLANLPEREVDQILQQHGMPRKTPATLTTPVELKADLNVIRARGYAIDDEEVEEGVRCVGVAVLGPNGRPLAAISVSAPSFRLPMEKVPVVASSVSGAAKRLSWESGYRGSWHVNVYAALPNHPVGAGTAK
jgi:DNA-binding IclR family transcriptional regulator